MEIKVELKKPYNEKQRLDFIVLNSHQKGYEIKETPTALEAWGDTEEEKLATAKQDKYNEALFKAKNYLDNGDAVYEFVLDDEAYHIEATDSNISKTGLKAIMLIQAQDPNLKDVWNTKEDINIYLNAEQFKEISLGLGAIQSQVWTVRFPYYLNLIEQAETLEEINSIYIDYSQPIEKPETQVNTEDIKMEGI